MLTQTTTPAIIISAAPVQRGPVYHCFECGQQADGQLVTWRTHPSNPSLLDDLAEYIVYMRLPCKHAGRAAKLGDCLTPLSFIDPHTHPDGWRAGVRANVAAVQTALRYIAATIPADERTVDPASRIVYTLLAGTLTPEEAIRQIRSIEEAH
ncbi:MAG: hypothetical protein AAB217_16310 [Chloroflexota bacterium]